MTCEMNDCNNGNTKDVMGHSLCSPCLSKINAAWIDESWGEIQEEEE